MKHKLRRYELIAEHSRDIVLFLKRNSGRIMETNAAAENAYGYSREELLELSIQDLRATETRSLTDDQMAEADTRGITFETVHRRKDGTTFPVEVSSQGATVDGVRMLISVIRNITERKNYENKLRQSEEKYRKIFEGASEGIYQTTIEGRYLNVNPAFARMFGFSSPQEMIDSVEDIGKQLYVDPQTRERMIRMLIDNDKAEGFEAEVYRKDKSKFWILINIHTVRDATGQILYFEGTNIDITERKIIEGSLQTALQLLHTLVSSIHSSILFVGEGAIELANQAFCDYFQLQDSPADLIGLTPPQMIQKIKKAYLHPEEEVTRIQEIIDRGQPVIGEEIAMQGGRTCIRDFIPIGVNGKSFGRLWHHTDITERKRAEEALRNVNDELEDRVRERTTEVKTAALYARSLIEASLDPQVTISTDGKIMDVNRASEQVTGVTRKQLIGSDFSDYFTEPAKARAGYERVFREGFVRDYALELKHRDGHVTPVLYNASLYQDETGRIMGVFAAARDITKRKEMEKEMLAVQRKLRAMASEIIFTEERSRQHFAADLHDTVVQTMGAAKLRSQLIQDQIPQKAGSIFTELQDMLSQSIAQARSIMAEMSPPVLSELGFVPALEWLTEQIENQHGLAIKFESSNDDERLGHETEVVLFQAARELLMNIVKHAKANKALVAVSGNQNIIRIEVKDDGKGFDGKISFHTKTSSGFGLFSIRERLKHLGGKLNITSQPGQGTRVIITAPRNIGQ